MESSESRRISNYQGTPSFYVRVHSRPEQGNNKLVLYKPLVMWGRVGGQFDACAYFFHPII